MKVNVNYTANGLLSILGLIFIIFKLTGIIDWSWSFILLPLVISGIIFIGIGITVLLILCKNWRKK